MLVDRELRKRGSITIIGPSGNIDLMVRPINSSNVEWIGWPVTGEPCMIVQYRGNYGGRYAYIGVSRQKAVAASYAPSTGGYINKKIKPKYECVKLR